MGGGRIVVCVFLVTAALGIMPARADDRGVEQALRAILRQDPMMRRSRNIKIKAENGTVYLWGKADSLYDKMQASLYAEQVQGVSEVHNCIKVHYRWPWEDEECGPCHEVFVDK